MDYKGWVLSIYDEYRKISKKRKLKKTEKSWESWLKKENIVLFFIVILMIVSFISIIVILILDLNNIKIISYIAIPIAIFIISMLIIRYKMESSLDNYEIELQILIEVLEMHNLYEGKKINKLFKATRGVSHFIKNLTFTLMSILVSTGIINEIVKFDKENIGYILIVIILITIVTGVIFYYIWILISIIPNNRIERSRRFHQLLKILLEYDDSMGEDEDSIDNIVEKGKKYFV